MFGEPLFTKAYKEEHLVLWPWQFRFHHWCGWEQPWIINIDMELPQLKPWDIFGKKEVCSCTPSLHYYHTKLNKSNHNKRDLNPCALNSWLLCCELNTQSSAYLFCYFFLGILRFYRGYAPALLQGPISRFGDTAANVGILALLEPHHDLPIAVKTGAASLSAGLWRIMISMYKYLHFRKLISRKK